MRRTLTLTLIAMTAACSPEQRAMKRLAGNYRWQLAGDGWQVSRTLTLRADGTATMSTESDIGGRPVSGSDAGTYAVHELTLTTRMTDQGVLKYTISGDTLFPQLAQREAMMSQMLGRRASDNLGEQAMVRVR
jgi:phage tail sheath gpL-like